MKVYLDTIGCRLNQSEIEIMAAQFRKMGHEIISSSNNADLVIINTCAVTNAAASDSRQKVRQAAKSGANEIILTGCWATLDPGAAAQLPGVESVVPNDQKENLVAQRLQVPTEIFDVEPLAREPLPGEHQRTRAFLKVQDGCDNFCTFCITKIARGKGVSRRIEEVLLDVNRSLAGGVKEVVLSGVHLGSWGKDLDHHLHLSDLVKAILAETDVPRLRLSSLEPWDLGGNFFKLWENPRLCPHLHLPLQSGSDEILKRMARKTSRQAFKRIVDEARNVVPDMAITTDMIVGFPGESDHDFDQTMSYVQEIQFASGHIFTYSARPGTAAAKIKEQVPGPIRRRRSAVLRAVFAEMNHRYHAQFLGGEQKVLWETSEPIGEGGWSLSGLGENYIRVKSESEMDLRNQISSVIIRDFSGDSMMGVITG